MGGGYGTGMGGGYGGGGVVDNYNPHTHYNNYHTEPHYHHQDVYNEPHYHEHHHHYNPTFEHNDYHYVDDHHEHYHHQPHYVNNEVGFAFYLHQFPLKKCACFNGLFQKNKKPPC